MARTEKGLTVWNGVREADWGLPLQDLVSQVKDFVLYLKSNRVPLKCFNLVGDMIRLVFWKDHSSCSVAYRLQSDKSGEEKSDKEHSNQRKREE